MFPLRSAVMLRLLHHPPPALGFRWILLSHPRPTVLRSQVQSHHRPLSTVSSEPHPFSIRLKNILYGTSLSMLIAFGYLYVTDTRASIHQWLVVPALRWFYPDAEDAHHAGTKALKALYSFGLHPRERNSLARDTQLADLSVKVFGQKLQNPIGISAGVDKLGEIPDALFALGPAIVEVGGATPFAQDGNPKPRVFRLPDQNALINRYGLNGKGAEDMARRLKERLRLFADRCGYGVGQEAEDFVLNGGAGVPPGSLIEGKLLAIQIAKNKDTKDGDIEAVKRDYVYCVERLAPYADILVVNVSSPNTPGLRTLQQVEPLTRILEAVVGASRSLKRQTRPRVMVKVSPDEDEDEQITGIVEAVWKSGVDGVIVGNTTKRRDNVIPEGIPLSPKERQILNEQGGFSGPKMFDRTLALVKRYRNLLDQGPSLDEETLESVSGSSSRDPTDETSSREMKLARGFTSPEQKVIFATGGITNGQQALGILNAGASVAQIYTAMVYGGSGTITRIKREMRQEIRARIQ